MLIHHLPLIVFFSLKLCSKANVGSATRGLSKLSCSCIWKYCFGPRSGCGLGTWWHDAGLVYGTMCLAFSNSTNMLIFKLKVPFVRFTKHLCTGAGQLWTLNEAWTEKNTDIAKVLSGHTAFGAVNMRSTLNSHWTQLHSHPRIHLGWTVTWGGNMWRQHGFNVLIMYPSMCW